MLDFFKEQPGLLFVAATLLPLLSFLLILLASGLWCLARPYRDTPLGGQLYQLLGGDRPGKLPAHVALGAIALACVLSVTGFVWFHQDQAAARGPMERLHNQIRELEEEKKAKGGEAGPLDDDIEQREKALAKLEEEWAQRRDSAWRARFNWLVLRP